MTAVAPLNSPVIVSPSWKSTAPSPKIKLYSNGELAVTNLPLAPDVSPFILSPRSKEPVIELTVRLGTVASLEESSES